LKAIIFDRLFKRLLDYGDADLLVAFQFELVKRGKCAEVSYAAARDNAFLDGRSRCMRASSTWPFSLSIPFL